MPYLPVRSPFLFSCSRYQPWSGNAVHPNIPGNEIDLHATVFGISHNTSPVGNFFVHGHLFQPLPVVEYILRNATSGNKFCNRLIGAVGIERERGATNIFEGNVGVVLHFNHRWKGMWIPQGKHVITVSRHHVDILFPKIEVPHFGNVVLSGIAGILITWRANIERNIEFIPVVLHKVRLWSGHSSRSKNQ
jgi:hypothetical protein